MGEPQPGSRPGRRVTLTEAAELLGTSRDAVRMRVRRGSLASEKGEDGRVYVFVEPDQDRTPLESRMRVPRAPWSRRRTRRSRSCASSSRPSGRHTPRRGASSPR
jgi:hypothetical protein